MLSNFSIGTYLEKESDQNLYVVKSLNKGSFLFAFKAYSFMKGVILYESICFIWPR